jgi:dTDP-4-dehydrorhamnose reductase
LKPATLYYDEIRTPTYTDCMNRLFHTLLASDLAGLYHAGGPRRLSLFQIAQIVNRIGGYDPEHVQTCSRFRGRSDSTAGRRCHDGFQPADSSRGL